MLILKSLRSIFRFSCKKGSLELSKRAVEKISECLAFQVKSGRPLNDF